MATLEFPLSHVPLHINLWFSPQCTLPSYYQLPHNANRGWLPSSSFDTFAIFIEHPTAMRFERLWFAVSKRRLLGVLKGYLQLYEAGDNVMKIPWSSWNSATRLITGIFPYSCCFSGTLFAFLVGPRVYEKIKQGLWTGVNENENSIEDADEMLTHFDRRIVLLDFNPYELRRQPDKSLRETDTTIHYTVDQTTCGYVISEQIETSMPFRLTCLKESVNYDGVQIDFENLVGIKTSPSVSHPLPHHNLSVLIGLLNRAKYALIYGASEDYFCNSVI